MKTCPFCAEDIQDALDGKPDSLVYMWQGNDICHRRTCKYIGVLEHSEVKAIRVSKLPANAKPCETCKPPAQ